MMQKKLLITGLFFITLCVNASVMAAQSAQPVYNINVGQQSMRPANVHGNNPTPAVPVINQQNIVNQVQTLATMQRDYASQPTNQAKAAYITLILDDDNPNLAIATKIEQAQNLLKIIDADLALYTAWWPTAEEKINIKWLQEQKIHIKQKLSRLTWFGQIFSMPTLWGTVKYTSVWLGAALVLYLATQQINNVSNSLDPEHPDKYKYDYIDIATLPATGIYKLAKGIAVSSTNMITDPSNQQAVEAALLGAQATFEGIISTIAETAHSAKETATKELHSLGNYIIKNTRPLTPQERLAQAAENARLKDLQRQKITREEEEVIKKYIQEKQPLHENLTAQLIKKAQENKKAALTKQELKQIENQVNQHFEPLDQQALRYLAEMQQMNQEAFKAGMAQQQQQQQQQNIGWSFGNKSDEEKKWQAEQAKIKAEEQARIKAQEQAEKQQKIKEEKERERKKIIADFEARRLAQEAELAKLNAEINKKLLKNDLETIEERAAREAREAAAKAKK